MDLYSSESVFTSWLNEWNSFVFSSYVLKIYKIDSVYTGLYVEGIFLSNSLRWLCFANIKTNLQYSE